MSWHRRRVPPVCPGRWWANSSPLSNAKAKNKRHGIGIVLPLLCRFAVIGFGVRGFAGHRVDGPGAAAGGVQLPLLLFRALLEGDVFFHGVSFHGPFGFREAARHAAARPPSVSFRAKREIRLFS